MVVFYSYRCHLAIVEEEGATKKETAKPQTAENNMENMMVQVLIPGMLQSPQRPTQF